MMMPDADFELTLPDSGATDALGLALAQALPDPLDDCRVLYLHGELGAGKTTCARSLLRGLGVTGLIRSPTFTLLEAYPLGAETAVHIDLYRLQGSLAVDELGLRDFLNPGCLLLIEWPEKGGAALPPADLQLTLRYAGNGRSATLHADTTPGKNWLRNLRLDTRLASYVVNLT
jgi:tRNA threonylcarbamoyladenosine biosynthesis protein TsaE